VRLEEVDGRDEVNIIPAAVSSAAGSQEDGR
jgi:hypothetical protein